MIIFLIKKCFYDFLDHFFCFLLLNTGFLISIIISLICSLACINLILFFFPAAGCISVPAAGILVIFILTVYTGAAAGVVHAVTENKPAGFKEFMHCLKTSLKNSLLLALVNSLFLFLFLNAFSFYTGVKWVFGHLAVAVLSWLGLLWYAASQYFFAVYYRLEKRFFKILKILFIIFLDNQLFSLGLLLASLLLGVLTIPTLLMIPGYTFLLLLTNLGLKFRLYKYTYLKTLAAADSGKIRQHKIPWLLLLEADIKQLGNRTIRDTFFPGKRGE